MAEDQVISGRVTEFVTRCIDSVEELRVLLMLQEQSQREWTFAEINNEMRSTLASIEKRVRDLIAKRVLAPTALRGDKVHFVPYSVEVEELLMVLAGHFRVRPYTVIDMIFSKPNPAIQSFANSFRFKKDNE
jgi:hypothetical protein